MHCPRATKEATCSALIPQGQKAGESPTVWVLGKGVRGKVAESQGHRWSEVTSLGSTARRLPLDCFLLEEESRVDKCFPGR